MCVSEQEQASEAGKAQAEGANHAASTSALHQMCLQLHSTAVEDAAAKKAALAQVWQSSSDVWVLHAYCSCYATADGGPYA